MPNGSQIPSHHQQDHQTRVQSGVDQAYMYQETRRRLYSDQIPFNLNRCAPPGNGMDTYSPLIGEPHSSPSGHSVR